VDAAVGGSAASAVLLGGAAAFFFTSNHNDEKSAYLQSHPDLVKEFGGHLSPALSPAYLSRATGWTDAIQNDPRLGRMMAQHHATLNIATGAIVVHESKNPQATAKAIRDELERWMRDRQERQ
jgi:hypothetical protein